MTYLPLHFEEYALHYTVLLVVSVRVGQLDCMGQIKLPFVGMSFLCFAGLLIGVFC